jgi:hypothetical protein
MIYLNENKIKILELLATYKFLTTSQFLRLGIVKYRPNLVNLLKDLRDRQKPFIARIKFPVHAKFGRIEDVYYLTRHGVKFLTEHLNWNIEDIKHPKQQNSFFFRDYFHRLWTIDFHIEFRLWTENKGYEILFFDYYFDKIGANRTKRNLPRLEALTKITYNNGKDHIFADAISMFKTPERKYLFCLEVYTGKDTKRIINQLEKYTLALAEGQPSLKYNFNRGARIYIILEHKSNLEAVLNRMRENDIFEEFENYFLFKTIDDLRKSFFYRWKNYKFEEKNFL